MLPGDVVITEPTERTLNGRTVEVHPASRGNRNDGNPLVRAFDAVGAVVLICSRPGCSFRAHLQGDPHLYHTMLGVPPLTEQQRLPYTQLLHWFNAHTHDNLLPTPEPEPELGTSAERVITTEEFERMLRLFKYGWHSADQAGLVGNRTEAGMINALLGINITLEEL